MDSLEKMVDLRRSGTPHVVVTVAAIRGSTPQDAGAKMVVTADGLATGTVGGGKIEAAAIRHASAMLGNGAPPELVTWNLQRDVGMTCGGEMQIFFEPFAGARWTIAVFGAGHVAQSLLPVLAPLDCRMLCFDTRADWLAKLPAAPNLHATRIDAPAAALATLPPDAFVLLITQGHATDLPILREALARHAFPFVGVIGSASKRATLERELRAAEIPADRIASFQCPLGLPIGSNHPQEIAISIAAGLLETRDRITHAGTLAPNP